MKKFEILLIVTIFFVQISSAQIIFKEPLSDRLTGYNIKATLDPGAKTVMGCMEAYWVNNSSDIVPDVQMHLYLNAFRNSRSTFNKEEGIYVDSNESDIGRIDIQSLTDREGTDLIPLMQHISPDDGNPEDMTVLKINLTDPAGPGDTVFLKIDFESKLPSNIIRTGSRDDFFFVAQWFPKFGVYESAGMRYAKKGGWNCHQFHSESEFYSNHSVYNVTITLPVEYVVGTGGLLQEEKDTGDGNKILRYRAEDIVDFAWTAWPGYAVFTDQWKEVKITLLLPQDRIKQAGRQFTAVKNALEYLSDHVGPYPWPYLTFVDPPSIGSGAGGMEYTTLFTSMSSLIMPEFLHFPEMVTIHEFGHAYFMGILANNEFEEPWLDEGVNSFWEGRIVDHYYGKNSGLIDHPLLKISDISTARMSYVNSSERQTISNVEYSWNYPHGTYGMMSYHKASVILQTLMGIIGEETTDEIFREYYRKWSFKHPSGEDFINVVNDVVTRIHGEKFGHDMNWFFNQTIYGTGICDYKVLRFSNKKLQQSNTNVPKSDSADLALSAADSVYKSTAELGRIGEVTLPVEVLIHFSNGEEVLESWDGKSRFKDFTYIGNRKIQWVKIDPEFKIKMDVNYINNSRTDDPDRVPVRRLTNKLIAFLQFFICFISL
jgi:hypothetical protein